MLYRLILAIHACTMSAALLMFVARELLLLAVRHGRIGAARTALHVNRVAGILTMIGVVAGISLFFLGAWPLTPWLIASLCLIAGLMLVERRMLVAWYGRAQAVQHGVAPCLDILALARDERALLARLVVLALFGLVALLMTVKPQLGF